MYIYIYTYIYIYNTIIMNPECSSSTEQISSIQILLGS